ncbi:dimethylaniline monooxygenase [N-oxide-forming] 2-like [Oppia nitens]|uniref:dimethylaniline monooxygenase [N-oxide-forming] 2-like n=1 Tax=Oppia nitens TaxID=1686743 RepID=UPI0023DA33A9|nr:dimethylaniline monooxygenase [N-oxide-forming] 2-like [Oppia nitens]
MISNNSKVCVIGAGAAGLSAVKSCLEEGLQVVCYEKTSNIGGLWYYRDNVIDGVGNVQKNTISNSSKEINAFSDFPYPKEFPNYLPHNKMYEYFQLYANHFNLWPNIHFDHTILKVDKSDDYETTHNIKIVVKHNDLVFTKTFNGVMVCTGHHTIPQFPQFSGQHLFKGKIIHSRDVRSQLNLKEYENKTAVVVGIGNSGCDVAVELSNLCDKTYMALRRGGWILHRMGPNGLPIDYQMSTRFKRKLSSILPFNIICWYFEIFQYNYRFNHRLYGIEPDFRCFSEIPIISDVLPTRIICGKVVVKKNISEFVENGVIFEMVMATGYHYLFPFIDKSLLDHRDDRSLNLYKQMFPGHLSHWSLALIGAVQPNIATFAIFEMQSRWYALLMSGKCKFPPNDHIMANINKENQTRKQQFYDSPKNSLAIDWLAYMDDIADIIGVKPNIKQYLLSDTQLFIKLIFGPTLSYQYRLVGPHSWSGARYTIMQSDYRVMYALNPNFIMG